jgi:uncharacterized protein involved in exopolysaccharide biosynthesis
LATQSKEIYVEEGVDALAIVTPLIERRRQIILGVLLISAAVGAWAAVKPRKYKAEMALTPVVNNRSTQALGGLAALAGATLQTGYQLTPGRMVELLKSRAVLSGVGFSQVGSSSKTRIIDRVVGERYDLNDAEDVAKRIIKLMDVEASKETGTITLSIAYKDSALARIIASRIVDSASVLFVRTSRAQAQQLRIAQEARVENAAAGLASAEERLRQFNDENRATPPFSAAGLEKDRLNRQIRFAEDVYNQAATDREAAYARELEATPTVVVQDPLPAQLPKVRKHIITKTIIAAVTSAFLLSFLVLLTDLTKRRLARTDPESTRFRNAIATLPRSRKNSHKPL